MLLAGGFHWCQRQDGLIDGLTERLIHEAGHRCGFCESDGVMAQSIDGLAGVALSHINATTGLVG